MMVGHLSCWIVSCELCTTYSMIKRERPLQTARNSVRQLAHSLTRHSKNKERCRCWVPLVLVMYGIGGLQDPSHCNDLQVCVN